MVKYGVVKIGETPSVLSGNPSEKFSSEGDAICKNEKLKPTKKVGAAASKVNIKKDIRK